MHRGSQVQKRLNPTEYPWTRQGSTAYTGGRKKRERSFSSNFHLPQSTLSHFLFVQEPSHFVEDVLCFVSSMGRFIILSTLLLGLVGVVNGQFLGQNENRQDFAPVDGCVPGKSNGACPVRMECFADKNFENGGRCDCKLKRACV